MTDSLVSYLFIYLYDNEYQYSKISRIKACYLIKFSKYPPFKPKIILSVPTFVGFFPILGLSRNSFVFLTHFVAFRISLLEPEISFATRGASQSMQRERS